MQLDAEVVQVRDWYHDKRMLMTDDQLEQPLKICSKTSLLPAFTTILWLLLLLGCMRPYGQSKQSRFPTNSSQPTISLLRCVIFLLSYPSVSFAPLQHSAHMSHCMILNSHARKLCATRNPSTLQALCGALPKLRALSVDAPSDAHGAAAMLLSQHPSLQALCKCWCCHPRLRRVSDIGMQRIWASWAWLLAGCGPAGNWLMRETRLQDCCSTHASVLWTLGALGPAWGSTNRSPSIVCSCLHILPTHILTSNHVMAASLTCVVLRLHHTQPCPWTRTSLMRTCPLALSSPLAWLPTPPPPQPTQHLRPPRRHHMAARQGQMPWPPCGRHPTTQLAPSTQPLQQ